MDVLVTGGAGFIGSHLADALLAEGHATRVLDDLSTGSADNVPPGAEFIEGDVTDPAVVAKAVDGVELVFHQAALGSVLRSVRDPLATDSTNTHGTLTVLTAAREAGVRRVVYASSSSVYGGSSQLPTPETVEAHPRSPYAVSKLAGEQYCRVFSALGDVETVSLRYFNVFGPRQSPDSQYAAVIPLFIRALSTGTPATVHGDGLQSRDFTYVEDVVAANLAAATASAERCAGKVYNVAGGGRHSLLDLLNQLGGIFGHDPERRHVERRAGDIRHSWADIAAARNDLGYEPRVSFEAGLRETVGWLAARAAEPRIS